MGSDRHTLAGTDSGRVPSSQINAMRARRSVQDWSRTRYAGQSVQGRSLMCAGHGRSITLRGTSLGASRPYFALVLADTSQHLGDGSPDGCTQQRRHGVAHLFVLLNP